MKVDVTLLSLLLVIVATIVIVTGATSNATKDANIESFHVDGNDDNQCSVDGTCGGESSTAQVSSDTNGDSSSPPHMNSINSMIAAKPSTPAIGENMNHDHNNNHIRHNNHYKHHIESPVPFPAMPTKIHAILHQDWNVLDPRGQELLHKMSGIDGAVEFAHARTTFYDHLKGTFSILSAWNQPEDVRRTGLVHTAYSGDLFQFYLYDSNKDEDRAQVRSLLGEKAEALTYLFGTINRNPLCHFKDVVNRITDTSVCLGKNETHTVHHRGIESGTWDVDSRTAANILMVTIADYLDQMVETNGWRDHHQIENGGEHLYPGSGRPALGFYWFSNICNGIKDHLEVIPSVFNNCETVITYDNDVGARDAYWAVVTEEHQLSQEEQVQLLNKTVSLNPFIGEPHMLLSQIYYRQKEYLKAAQEARSALERFYTLASCWDKRRSFDHWVGFSRILLLRANRMLEQHERSLPVKDAHNPLYVNYNKLELTSLRETVDEMKAREEVVLA